MINIISHLVLQSRIVMRRQEQDSKQLKDEDHIQRHEAQIEEMQADFHNPHFVQLLNGFSPDACDGRKNSQVNPAEWRSRAIPNPVPNLTGR